MHTGTRKMGPMSIVHYRAWRAAHGNWSSHWLRPEPEDVDRAMVQLSAAFGQTEAEIVRPLMARAAYTKSERADLFADVRQAIAVVATAAWRIAQDGGYLTDNLLFDEIARRWSPTYERALIESAAARPNQMRPETLEAARADIRAQGLRLGRLIALARRDVRGWYKPELTAKGWRVRPLRKPDATSRLALAGTVQPRTEVEISRPDTIVGEIAYEPIPSGPRSVAVMNVLERTQLQLDVRAAREELVGMKAERDRRKAKFEAVRQPHRKVPKPADAPKGRYGKDYTWEPRWTPEEVRALAELREAREPVEALAPVVNVLPPDGKVLIQTRYEQKINRRWHAVTFGVEHVGHTDTVEEITYPAHPDWVDEEGVFEAAEPEMTRTTWRRARMFKPYEGRAIELGDLAGYDVASSQYQILSIFLGDAKLEQQLQTRSAHEIAASQVWPDDPEGPARAKLVTVAGGYGSKPYEIARNTGLTVEEARAILSAISPSIEIFRAYTRKIAWAVPQYEGFTFIDPFDHSRVTWYPVRVREHEIRSNTKGESYKLMTFVPTAPLNAEGRASVNRHKLQQQIAPMLVHAMDSAFSGFVIEELVKRGVQIVALFDCWLVHSGDREKLQEAINAAGEPWLRSLQSVYDALLDPRYRLPKKDRRWMEDCADAYKQRVAASERDEKPWPILRTKPIDLEKWDID